MPQIRAGKIRKGKIRAGKIKADEIRADEIGADQIGADQIETDQIETDQIGADQIETDQIGAREIGAGEFGADQIRELGRRHLPRKAVEELLGLALPSVALRTRPARAGLGHESRLGGRPKVAPEFSWPRVQGRPLYLIEVLQLAALATVDPTGLLPKRGYLDLFVDVGSPQVESGPYPPEGFRVEHVDVDLYEERPTPAGAEQYPAVAVEAVPQVSLPHPREPEMADLAERYGPKLRRFHDEYIEVAGVPRHRLFGWPDLVEGPMRASLPKVRSTTWQLLSQVDSDDELDWSWGNVGRLYLWVPASDLRKAKFDRAQLVLQTY